MPSVFSADKKRPTWYKTVSGKILLTTLAVFFILLTLFGALTAYYLARIKLGDEKELARQFYSDKFSSADQLEQIKANSVNLRVQDYARDHNPSFGQKQAPVTILVFIDYRCPFCREAHAQFEDIARRYKDSIRVVYKQFPLDMLHRDSSQLARLSLCAAEQEGYARFYDRLFTNPDFADMEPSAQAEVLGLKAAGYIDCAKSDKYNKQIQQDIKDGLELGVRGTPTYLVNRNKIEGIVEQQIWDQILIQEITTSEQ